MIGPEFAAVLGAAARGDGDAFERLWDDLQPRLLRYFMVVSTAVAEDLASETWLGVVRGIGRFRGTEPAFRAWVFTIARHEVLDWRRRAARRATEDLLPADMVEQARRTTRPPRPWRACPPGPRWGWSRPCLPIRRKPSCSGWWPDWTSIGWRPSWASVQGQSGC
jgi:Sigma-70 region 2